MKLLLCSVVLSLMFTGTVPQNVTDVSTTADKKVTSKFIYFDCYQNGTVVAQNSNPDEYRASVANNSQGICDTRFSQNFTQLIISGCSINEDIYLVLSGRLQLTDGIVGGVSHLSYIIRCSEIPITGFTRLFTHKALTALIAPEDTADINLFSVTPHIRIPAGLRDDFVWDSPQRRQAPLSTKLFWTIDVPVQYYGIPTYCKAVAGLDVDDSNALVKDLIVSAWSADQDLVGDFTNVIRNFRERRLYTTFFVFKFYSSDYITLQCTIEYCRHEQDCQPTRNVSRIRRYADSGHVAITTIHVTEEEIASLVSGAPSTGAWVLLWLFFLSVCTDWKVFDLFLK